jgi:hypothetical protein
MPLLWVEMKFGPKWREERRVRMDKEAEEEKTREEQEERLEGRESGVVSLTDTLPVEGEKKEENV